MTGNLLYGPGPFLSQANPDGSGGYWFGNFNPGDTIVTPTTIAQAIVAYEPVGNHARVHLPLAYGFQIQTAALGGFWVEMRAQYVTSFVNDGYLTASTNWLRFTGGMSTDAADGSANFLGIVSNDPAHPIHSVEVRVRPLSQTVFGASYGIANARFGQSVTFETVPEPASMTALGLGAVALLRRRRRA